MITTPIDLNVEIRSADGSSTEFYQTDEEKIHETLNVLAAPRVLAQRHLVIASKDYASLIPCAGIDMILVRTSARSPLRFPLNLPVGRFDIVEQTEDAPEYNFAEIEPESGQTNRHVSQVEVQTLGGWNLTLKTVAMIRGRDQDERQLFSHLPDVPSIPFRLLEGGFGIINTANITRASVWPKPEAIPGTSLPLILRRWTPSLHKPALAQ